MRTTIRALLASAAVASLTLHEPARAQEEAKKEEAPKKAEVRNEDPDLQKRVEKLSKEVDSLKRQVKKDEEKSLSRWLTVGGDYRFRLDSLRGDVPEYFQFVSPTAPPVLIPGFNVRNNTLMTNRFGLNLKAKATKDVTVTSRLLMYKTFGMQTADPINAGFFADRAFVMDGSIGHVPIDSTLRVDQVFATWSNIADLPVWFSVGRRPSTGGSPTHVRENDIRPTSAGVPGLLVDYAFDGMTLGYAPEIDKLPGAFTKICFGRGFEAGYSSKNSLADTDMLGVQVFPIDTDPLRLGFQWNRGFNIFDNPVNVGNQVGDMDWYGVDILSTFKNVGPGTITLFASGGMSVTHPNGKHALLTLPDGSKVDSGAGLLVNGPDTSSHTGYAAYVGARYDFPTGTKIGAEYNHGTEFWTPFDPAADDMWTSKLGTRGNVYEAYLIQELPLAPISSFGAKAYFRIGYQYYDFTSTGSNNWIGAPVKVNDLAASPFNAQLLTPLKSAQDIYGTFEVRL